MADVFINDRVLATLRSVALRFMNGTCTIRRRASRSASYSVVQSAVPCSVTSQAAAGSPNPYQQTYTAVQVAQMLNQRLIELPFEYVNPEGATVAVDVRSGDQIEWDGNKYKVIEAATDETIPVSIVCNAEMIDTE